MDKSLITKIVIEALAVIALSISLKEEFKKAKRLLYKLFLVFLILAIGVYGVIDTIDTYHSNRKDKGDIIDTTKNQSKVTRDLVSKRSDTTDKNINRGFSKTGSQIDAVGKKIAKKTISYGLLNLSSMPKGVCNPCLIKSDKTNEVTFHIELTNWGTGFAYDVDGVVLFVDKGKNGLYVANIPRKSQLNKRIGITPDKFNHTPIEKKFDNMIRGTDSVFACVKFNFSDSTRVRKSMFRVFNLERDLSMGPAMNDDEIIIEKFLIKNKYWKPPFKQ